jgi:hypothetical protein
MADQQITFQSAGDLVYGTFVSPPGGGGAVRVPAAVIIAGSGPTDRDGNSGLASGRIDTLKNFAQVLAAHGIASIRYDKLGTGATGLGSFASHPDDIDFGVYIDEAVAAYEYLRTRPEIDPRRIMILGHSEGALIAMVVGTRLTGDAGPKALVLAAPAGSPYLETIRRQLGEQYAVAVSQSLISQATADSALADVDRVVDSLKQFGIYPAGDMTFADPALGQIFSRGNERFLADVERYVPAQLAAMLPATLHVLILRGDKDQQVKGDDAAQLLQALQSHDSVPESDSVPNADHVFKDVPGTPNAAADYTNPALPFSPEAAQKLGAFVDSVFGSAR